MSNMTADQKKYLEDTFNSRVSFDPTERKLYSHDIAAMPKLIKPLIGKTLPDAVVQPEAEEELISLAKWANREKIPLVPRGKATSGYGGVVPVRRGIVVDFYRMRKILDIDRDKMLATVEPGITWEQLDRELNKEALALRLYPTSYPSSSVGGWLAHGGAGIGSYEYGFFPENVVLARVVLHHYTPGFQGY